MGRRTDDGANTAVLDMGAEEDIRARLRQITEEVQELRFQLTDGERPKLLRVSDHAGSRSKWHNASGD